MPAADDPAHRNRRRTWQGIACIMAAFMLFALLDTCSKYLSRYYPVSGLMWARYVVHMVLMLLLFGPYMQLNLIYTARPGMQVLRGLLLTVTTFLFMSAIKYLPLAEASAIGFTSPLLLAALSGPLLKEPASRANWIAVCAGFCGVLIILRPGGGLLTPAVLLPLGMAVTNSLYHIVTRKLAARENPVTSLFYTALVGSVAMSVVAPFAWVTPSGTAHLALLLALGVFGGAGHYLVFQAFRRAPPAVLGPFTYVHLIWACALGYLVFDEFPDGWTLGGMGVIMASGLYIAFAERARLRAPAPAPVRS